MKYPKSEAIHEAQLQEIPAYASLEGTKSERANGLRVMNEATQDFQGVSHASLTSHWNNFSNLDGNNSGRPGLMKSDYYRFRPGEAPPSLRNYKEVIQRCDEAYQHVGLIKNVIDLMGDFACQGIRVSHPNKKIEKFFRNWWARVGGSERSERFCNNLFRTGNVVVRKHTAKITAKIEEMIYKSMAEADMDVSVKKITSKEIPFKYIFLEPTTVEVVGGPLANFVGNPRYKINLSNALRKFINSPSNEEEKALIAELPQDIVNAAKTSRSYILPSDKTRVFHYKKDDWQMWANPMIYSILDDVSTLEKLRLADMAALDGAISNIRIFKLGSLEHKIAPSKTAAAKLASILQNNVGGGTIDLIWGPDLEFIESKSVVYQFLGEEKYKPTYAAIYNGLGVPPTLTGGGGTGTTNNFIALRTLIQRLQYCRNVLLSFWNAELAEVQKAMGFRFPAKIEFDIDILEDVSVVRALLVQLADRNLISEELLQERFGHDPELEEVRINRESKERNTNKRPNKASPFHDPQFGYALKKMALQTGLSTPSQVGLSPDAPTYEMMTYEGNPNEKTLLDIKGEQAIKLAQMAPKTAPGGTSTTKKKGVPQQGRPKNSKDTIKRKTKKFTPKLKASLEVWLKNAQASISENVNEMFLKMVNKKTMRSLSNEEVKKIEKIKFELLFNTKPFDIITPTYIYGILNKSSNKDIYRTYESWIHDISGTVGRQLTMEELKQIQITLYTNLLDGV